MTSNDEAECDDTEQTAKSREEQNHRMNNTSNFDSFICTSSWQQMSIREALTEKS